MTTRNDVLVIEITRDIQGTILLALHSRWDDLNRARDREGDTENVRIQLQRIEDAAEVVAGA